MAREDDFEVRREHLRNMSDEDLYNYFWELAEKLTDPLLEAGKKYTTPAIERSVLLRMGFSSIEAKPIVDGLIERELISKGAGNVVWRLSQKLAVPVRDAGLALIEGKYWDMLPGLFE